MTRKDFTKLIEVLEKKEKESSEIYQKYSIDLVNYVEDYYNVIGLLMSYVFTEKGWDWISYFLYENNPKIWENGEEIPFNSIDDLYNFLLKEGIIKE